MTEPILTAWRSVHPAPGLIRDGWMAGADLSRADLSGAYGRDDWDALVKRGAVR